MTTVPQTNRMTLTGLWPMGGVAPLPRHHALCLGSQVTVCPAVPRTPSVG